MGSYKPIPPVEVSDGPILENVQEGDQVDLSIFPIPKWHPQDGGPYAGTYCAVIQRDPDSGYVNMGTYRVQVHDKKTLANWISPGKHGRIIREKYWAKGQSCPVVVVFGMDPRIYAAASIPLPWGEPELNYAGYLYGRPVKVVLGKHTGIPIPADAEFAVEGEIPPMDVEGRLEGPFGEWPGYFASGEKMCPIIKVKAVYYRDGAILCGAPPLVPTFGRIASIPGQAANLWDQLEKMGLPGIRGVWVYPGTATGLGFGGGTHMNVVSIKQEYPGHAKQVAMATAASLQGGYQSKLIVVVDEDIDPSDLGKVMWAICTRCDPSEDIDIVRGTWDTLLDPRLPPDRREALNTTISKALILAVRPFHWKDKYPQTLEWPEEVKAPLRDKWAGALGLK